MVNVGFVYGNDYNGLYEPGPKFYDCFWWKRYSPKEYGCFLLKVWSKILWG